MSRTWTIQVAFSQFWLTSNKTSLYRHHARPWREAAHVACIAARLPKGITPVTIHAVCWYVGRPPVRETPNLDPTIKAIVDGLTPKVISHRGGKPHARGGYGLIPDDSDRHVLARTFEMRRSDTVPWVDLTITEVEGDI